MPTDLTGTPTALGIGTYNTSVDAPSGLGFNAAMGQIDALIAARALSPSGIVAGEFPVWNGSTWVRSSALALSTLADSAYGTSLPGSPIDGQHYTLVDSTSNPSYQWRFRYNAGSASAYKWEFVGGSPWTNWVATAETTTSGSAADLTTAQFLTIPRAGDYDFLVGCQAANNTAGAAQFVDIWTRSMGVTISNVNYASDIALQGRATGLAAASTLRMQYHVGSGTGTYSNRFFTVQPVRVS